MTPRGLSGALVALIASSAVVHAPSAARFVQFRVCAYDHYSSALGECTTQQSAESLLSTRFGCSTTVVATARTPVTMQWIYNGTGLRPFHETFPRGSSSTSIKLDSGQPDGPLPGGRYQCAFSDGKHRVTKSFTSVGPTGTVVDITVCDGAQVFRYSGFPVCEVNESSVPLHSIRTILCEGIFPDSRGKAEIEMLDPNGIDKTAPGSSRIDGPIVQIYAEIKGPFAPGPYSCNFALNGQIVAQKPFQVVQ